MLLHSIASKLNKKSLQIAALALLACLLFVVVYLFRVLNSPLQVSAETTYFEVEPGSSLTRVARELDAENLIKHPRIFSLYGQYSGAANSIQSGEYEITAGISARDFLDMMVAGNTVQYRLTLVEGWTLQQSLTAIWGSPNTTREIEPTNAAGIAAVLGLPTESAEGLLFPDTYFYTKGSSDIEILRRANSRLENVLEEAWDNRLGALPYDNSYDALIMASIIEKESAAGSDRGDISGVFVRRLEQGMRLQSDPTVIYGMGENHDGDIRREDLLEETAYNTYRINGLPPTPIALAGIESILASLNPLPSNYLYFVSKGDGTHYFSSTLEEHNAAVNRFQLNQQSQ